MKFCYADESGTGDEPIAAMVGIIVDAQRMHITKHDWNELLAVLSEMAGREITELHTRDFYAGNGVFRDIPGAVRARLISRICEWIRERRHHLVYASVCKGAYRESFAAHRIPDELNTVWRFMGFHLVLALQKHCQRHGKNKGNTVLIFDNAEMEKLRFTDVIMRPPEWSADYYDKKPTKHPLDQIVDAPFFGDSKDVALIQLADFVAFFLRRYAEIKEDLIKPRYAEEGERIDGWIAELMTRSIGTSYKKIGRTGADDLFFENASVSIRNLG